MQNKTYDESDQFSPEVSNLEDDINEYVYDALPAIHENDDTQNNQLPKVGHHIEVFWPEDKEFYPGKVVGYNDDSGSFEIHYDDDDREVLRLEDEKWRDVPCNSMSGNKAKLKELHSIEGDYIELY